MITSNDDATKAIRQAGRTPRALFDGLNREHRFDVDCFASISNHLLPNYWTRAHDAFKRRLNGRKGFANPPFGILRRALEWGYEQRNESFTCFLVPASIETAWFLEVATKGDKHCFDNRVRYVAPPGVEYSQPSFASCLVMFGPGVRASDLAFTAVRDASTGALIRLSAPDSDRSPRIHVEHPKCIHCDRVVKDRCFCTACGYATKTPIGIIDDLPF